MTITHSTIEYIYICDAAKEPLQKLAGKQKGHYNLPLVEVAFECCLKSRAASALN